MLRILIVDRDRDTTDALSMVFEAEGWRSDAAADAYQALATLDDDGAYDAVLLDVSLPLTEGLAFLREKQRRPAISAVPVVAMTSDVGIPETIEGVVRVLRKPFAIGLAMAALCHAAAYGPGNLVRVAAGHPRRA
jgi:DNA-binding response OmpR family regulator